MRKRIAYHFFSIQKNDLSPHDGSGAVDRRWRFVVKNLRCQIQQVNRGTAVEKYDIKVAEILYVIYHNNYLWSVDSSTRFIISVDPRQQIGETPQESGIKILQFIGTSEEVMTKVRRKTNIEIYAEWNKRWTL